MGQTARIIALLAGICAAAVAAIAALVADGFPLYARMIVAGVSTAFVVVALAAWPTIRLATRPLRRLFAAGTEVRSRVLAARSDEAVEPEDEKFRLWQRLVEETLLERFDSEDQGTFAGARSFPAWSPRLATGTQSSLLNDIECHLTALQRIIERHR